MPAAGSTPASVAASPIPTQTLFFTPEVYFFSSATPSATPVPITSGDVKFLQAFSANPAYWDVLPTSVTAAQLNQFVAELEGMNVTRAYQKVMNGFVRGAVEQEGGQVFDALLPAEIFNGKLRPLKVKNVQQIPVISSHAVLLEDYFELNFPKEYQNWLMLGAPAHDLKYAAVITVTWITKFGPLRVSYLLSGKYIVDSEKYPNQLEFIKICMFEQTIPHYSHLQKLIDNWYPAPIVSVSGALPGGKSGEMKSDAFGWTPMRDFTAAQLDVLSEISGQVNGMAIESPESLAQIQAAFDKAFVPVHCVKSVFE